MPEECAIASRQLTWDYRIFRCRWVHQSIRFQVDNLQERRDALQRPHNRGQILTISPIWNEGQLPVFRRSSTLAIALSSVIAARQLAVFQTNRKSLRYSGSTVADQRPVTHAFNESAGSIGRPELSFTQCRILPRDPAASPAKLSDKP
jgi:hypothetical protein